MTAIIMTEPGKGCSVPFWLFERTMKSIETRDPAVAAALEKAILHDALILYTKEPIDLRRKLQSVVLERWIRLQALGPEDPARQDFKPSPFNGGDYIGDVANAVVHLLQTGEVPAPPWGIGA